MGKTSLKHELMNEQLPSVSESTIVAKVHHTRPVRLEWAKVEDTPEKAYWEVVTSEHEIEEIAQLMIKTKIAFLSGGGTWRLLSPPSGRVLPRSGTQIQKLQ